MLSVVMLWSVMICCGVMCYVTLCYVMSCVVVLSCFMLCVVVWCYAMLCYVMLCCVVSMQMSIFIECLSCDQTLSFPAPEPGSRWTLILVSNPQHDSPDLDSPWRSRTWIRIPNLDPRSWILDADPGSWTRAHRVVVQQMEKGFFNNKSRALADSAIFHTEQSSCQVFPAAFRYRFKASAWKGFLFTKEKGFIWQGSKVF